MYKRQETSPIIFNGIALGTIAAILVYHLMAWVSRARGIGDAATPIEPSTETGRVHTV